MTDDSEPASGHCSLTCWVLRVCLGLGWLHHTGLLLAGLLEVVSGDLLHWGSPLNHCTRRGLPFLAHAVDADDDGYDDEENDANDKSDGDRDGNVDHFLGFFH